MEHDITKVEELKKGFKIKGGTIPAQGKFSVWEVETDWNMDIVKASPTLDENIQVSLQSHLKKEKHNIIAGMPKLRMDTLIEKNKKELESDKEDESK